MQGLNKDNVEALIKAGFERHQNEELEDAEKQLADILAKSNFLAHHTRGEDAVKEIKEGNKT